MIAKPKVKRSRTGCYTCRKRKKKCDESDYPICKNCQSKKLSCKWPIIKQEFYQKLQQVRYVEETEKVIDKKGILERIMLQQDVDLETNEISLPVQDRQAMQQQSVQQQSVQQRSMQSEQLQQQVQQQVQQQIQQQQIQLPEQHMPIQLPERQIQLPMDPSLPVHSIESPLGIRRDYLDSFPDHLIHENLIKDDLDYEKLLNINGV